MSPSNYPPGVTGNEPEIAGTEPLRRTLSTGQELVTEVPWGEDLEDHLAEMMAAGEYRSLVRLFLEELEARGFTIEPRERHYLGDDCTEEDLDHQAWRETEPWELGVKPCCSRDHPHRGTVPLGGVHWCVDR